MTCCIWGHTAGEYRAEVLRRLLLTHPISSPARMVPGLSHPFQRGLTSRFPTQTFPWKPLTLSPPASWLRGEGTELALTSRGRRWRWLQQRRSDFQLLGIDFDDQIERGTESPAGPTGWVLIRSDGGSVWGRVGVQRFQIHFLSRGPRPSDAASASWAGRARPARVNPG